MDGGYFYSVYNIRKACSEKSNPANSRQRHDLPAIISTSIAAIIQPIVIAKPFINQSLSL